MRKTQIFSVIFLLCEALALGTVLVANLDINWSAFANIVAETVLVLIFVTANVASIISLAKE